MTDNIENKSTEEKIDRYVNGDLSSRETDKLWADLIRDESNMNYLKNTVNLKEVVRNEDRKISRRVWMYAAAAVVILLIAVMGSVQLGLFSSNKAGINPVNTIALDYNRSAEAAPLSKHRKIIRKAIILFNDGKLDEALEFLRSERNKANENVWLTKIDMTLGIIYYDTDDFNNAAFYFAEIIKKKDSIKKPRLERAYWYLGNAYFQMGMLKKAHVLMETTYHLNGSYSRAAKSYLDALADYHRKIAAQKKK